ncbi:hypothetical protein DAEQUDRAFT_733920 [Daedalea quercina L-15889]|uniref:Uncharacterized protein n=1 Tax=Daedalea quercina L-15889 TaxID=1314783 RepID=A0A165KN97_9APHY|nr:hypothetical protein DAEQUDRAFT_733920 [Daedalea quercina L-15889]
MPTRSPQNICTQRHVNIVQKMQPKARLQGRPYGSVARVAEIMAAIRDPRDLRRFASTRQVKARGSREHI